jgi:hypothetical protein
MSATYREYSCSVDCQDLGARGYHSQPLSIFLNTTTSRNFIRSSPVLHTTTQSFTHVKEGLDYRLQSGPSHTCGSSDSHPYSHTLVSQSALLAVPDLTGCNTHLAPSKWQRNAPFLSASVC